jgi:hypothetical protein
MFYQFIVVGIRDIGGRIGRWKVWTREFADELS